MKQLYGEYTESGSLIVFRGQTSEHRLPDGRLALIPSAFRSPPPALKPTGLMPAVTRYLELYLKTADESTRRVFRQEFGSRFRTFIDAYDEPSPVSALFHVSELTDLPAIYAAFLNHEFWAAVAQHYGLPTGLLDVTTDPDVALWFALHKYTRRAGGRCVDYESTGGAGYVYALRVIANPRHVIPLSTQNGGSAHNRLPCCPRRQPSRRRRSRARSAARSSCRGSSSGRMPGQPVASSSPSYSQSFRQRQTASTPQRLFPRSQRTGSARRRCCLAGMSRRCRITLLPAPERRLAGEISTLRLPVLCRRPSLWRHLPCSSRSFRNRFARCYAILKEEHGNAMLDQSMVRERRHLQ
jgi:hypothetical protein